MSKFTAAGKTYLPQMTKDSYYPPAEVTKVRVQLERLVDWLEEGEHAKDEIQMRLDVMVENINDLQDDFANADSEIETVAREDIAATVMAILEVYKIDIDIETAIGARDW